LRNGQRIGTPPPVDGRGGGDAAEGAGDHCEMTNRSLLNRTALDWLDETLD
jgi:hypothetical protein